MVIPSVPCTGGCTLTQGYWKTHSAKGPAPYDDTWKQIGEDTIFFKSGKSYHDVLWTPPAGNAYYNLAHQYIAAQLNVLNDATMPPAVKTAFDEATALFTSKTPGDVAGLKGAAKQKWTSLAGMLAAFNEGATGPGHCDEDATSNSSFKQQAATSSKSKKDKKKGKNKKGGKKSGKGKQAQASSKGGKNREGGKNRN